MAQRQPAPHWPRGLLVGVIALLHVALWWLPVVRTTSPATPTQTSLAITLRLPPPTPPKPAARVTLAQGAGSATRATEPPPGRPSTTTQGHLLRAGPRPPAVQAGTDTRAQAPADPPLATAPAEPVDRPDQAASATAGSAHQLLDSAATRQAIRAATRAPLLSERADAAAQAPERAQASERLGQQIQRAGHGDCLKGEFTGASLGLLSLPLLALAEATGKCRK